MAAGESSGQTRSLCEAQHPLERSGPVSRALLLWLFPLLLQGRKSPLTEKDVWPLPSWVHSDVSAEKVQQEWSARQTRGPGLPSLLAVLRTTFGHHMWRVMAAAMFSCVAFQLPPLFLGGLFTRLLEEEDDTNQSFFDTAWFWAILVYLAAVMVAVGPSSAQRTQIAVGIEVRNSLLCNIYHTLLRLKSSRCVELGRHGLSAMCTTLAGVDCDRVYLLCHFGMFLILDLLLIVACFPMLVLIIGPVGLWGCALLAVGTLMQKIFMDAMVKARAKMQHHTDQRLALTQELFENIRSVKMCGLELTLRTQIDAEREKELKAQWQVFVLRSLNSACTYAMVPVALLTTLFAGTRGSSTTLKAAAVFAALAFLNTNRIVFTVLPFELNTLSEGLASLGRIHALFCSGGYNIRHSDKNKDGGGSVGALGPGEAVVKVEQGQYCWRPGDQPTKGPQVQQQAGQGQSFDRLLIPSLELRPGCLAVVVGQSGGGKSSLCGALTGWMPQLAGTECSFGGKVAYCPQEPWVLSGTIEENITGTCYFATAEALQAAAWQSVKLARFDADVGNFPGAMKCEIGFRGLNLSGGQKARLGLARALAMRDEAAAFILDDVLSALDGPTAEWIAQNTILEHLKGVTRVVVLNSHYELLLPHADVVILMENGSVTTYSSAHDFSSSGFAKLLAHPVAEGQGQEQEQEQGGGLNESRQCPEWIRAGLPHGLTTQELTEEAADEPGSPAGGKAEGASGKLFEVEFRAQGPLDPWLYTTYFNFGSGAAGQGGWVLSAVLLAIVAILMVLPDAVRLLSEFFLSQALEDGVDIGDQAWLWQFALLTIATSLCALLRPLVFMALARRSSRRLHQRLLDRICGAPVNTFFDVVPPGRLMNLCGKDLDVIDTLIPSTGLDFLQDVSMLFTTVLVSVVMIPPVLVVLLPAAWALLKLRRLLMCSARELVRLEANSRSPTLTMLTETVAGLPVIRSQRAEEAMYRRFCVLANKNSSFYLHGWFLMPWLSFWLDELVAVFVFAACISALFLKAAISPSLLVVALTNNIALLSKVQITCRASAEVEKLFTSVERLSHALGTTPSEERAPPHGRPALDNRWPDRGVIAFEEVSLRYRPGLPLVLASLSFQVAAGESVGLIGRSGSGKSTCLRAVLRMTELSGGRICIDGVDIAQLPLGILRSRLAVVPQEPLVLSGSIRRNLMPLHGGTASEMEPKCWQVLDLLGLSKLVRDSPEGLDMELAAGAESVLSLGQRQLLSLGRALMHPSKVLCVDEATANVDGATDAALQRAMASNVGAGGPRTRLIIAHRLWTLRHCHEVLLLKPGPPTSVLRIRNPSVSADARQELEEGGAEDLFRI